jgi:hypothetical protein
LIAASARARRKKIPTLVKYFSDTEIGKIKFRAAELTSGKHAPK